MVTMTSQADACDCGAADFCITATLISCVRCGRLWGLVFGRWVYDFTTEPGYRAPSSSWEDELDAQLAEAA
jgi:hypothetical protein